MLINADLSRRAMVAPHQHQWVASPQKGVERVMLDRAGDEHGRATSIVRYASGAHFPRHTHPQGEEILVLSGTLSDGDNDYPSGWYLRNPPGSSHQPYSESGAVIFVKLGQMPSGESEPVRIDTHLPSAWHRAQGREICSLFSSEFEQVSLLRLLPRVPLRANTAESIELLVISGSVLSRGHIYESGSWIRLPPGTHPKITASSVGTTLYLKVGRLAGFA